MYVNVYSQICDVRLDPVVEDCREACVSAVFELPACACAPVSCGVVVVWLRGETGTELRSGMVDAWVSASAL